MTTDAWQRIPRRRRRTGANSSPVAADAGEREVPPVGLVNGVGSGRRRGERDVERALGDGADVGRAAIDVEEGQPAAQRGGVRAAIDGFIDNCG